MVTMDNREIAPEKCGNGNDVETGKNEKCRSSGVWRMVSLYI